MKEKLFSLLSVFNFRFDCLSNSLNIKASLEFSVCGNFLENSEINQRRSSDLVFAQVSKTLRSVVGNSIRELDI